MDRSKLLAAIKDREAELGRPLKTLADLAPTAQILTDLIDRGKTPWRR